MRFDDATKSKLAAVQSVPTAQYASLPDIESVLDFQLKFSGRSAKFAFVAGDGKDAASVISIVTGLVVPYAVLGCVGQRVDYAKVCPGRRWLGEIVVGIERAGWRVVDAIVDARGETICVLLAEGKTKIHPIAKFWRFDRIVSLSYTSVTDMMRTKSVCSGNFYEHYMLDHIASTYNGGDIVDVGANIGNHTVHFGLMAAKFDGHVHAVEPGPTALKLLRSNIKANALESIVSINGFAAGEASGVAFIQSGNVGNIGAYRVSLEKGTDTVSVGLSRLDALVPTDRRVSVMKIDVEGYELPALRGATELISRCKPDLYIEADSPARRDAITAELAPFGYQRLEVFNDTPTYHFKHVG